MYMVRLLTQHLCLARAATHTMLRFNLLRGIRGTFPPQWRIGHTLDSAVRPNKLRNVCVAGIEPSLCTATMPCSRLKDYPCEKQTQNPGKDAILYVVLPEYNE